MPTIDELRAQLPKFKDNLRSETSICEKCHTQTFYKPGGQHFNGCTGKLLPLNVADTKNKTDSAKAQLGA